MCCLCRRPRNAEGRPSEPNAPNSQPLAVKDCAFVNRSRNQDQNAGSTVLRVVPPMLRRNIAVMSFAAASTV